MTYKDPLPNLEHFIVIAVGAHAGQVDKGGHPYIMHPLRVMLKCKTLEEQIVAVLHDLLEDTRWSKYGVYSLEREGLTPVMSAALTCLTRSSGESYEEFIERIALNPLATRVKLADLEDNMDLTRLETIQPHDLSRQKKYQRAKARLEIALQGHSKK